MRTSRFVTVLASMVALSMPLAADAVGGSGERAAGPVVVGSTDGALQDCGDIALLMGSTAPGGPSWTSPIDGVITSWKHGAGGDPGSVRLLVVRPSTQTPGGYDVVGKSANQTITTGVFNTFAARVPILAGQQLGLDVNPDGATMPCVTVGSVGDAAVIQAAFDSDTATVLVPTTGAAAVRMDLSAVVEPDVDHDGYGDVSQELCPQSASTQAACPAPDTTVSKAPRKKSTKRKAAIAFTATTAGSTFTCAVDGKAAVPCVSPFKKRYRPGKHTVVITATSPVGIVDPTPATVTFKVTKPKG
jgi:hypothetical protein